MKSPDNRKEIIQEKNVVKHCHKTIVCEDLADGKSCDTDIQIERRPVSHVDNALLSSDAGVKVKALREIDELPSQHIREALLKDPLAEVRIEAMLAFWYTLCPEEHMALAYDVSLGVRLLYQDLQENGGPPMHYQ